MSNELTSLDMKAYEAIWNSRFMSHEGKTKRLDSPLMFEDLEIKKKKIKPQISSTVLGTYFMGNEMKISLNF